MKIDFTADERKFILWLIAKEHERITEPSEKIRMMNRLREGLAESMDETVERGDILADGFGNRLLVAEWKECWGLCLIDIVSGRVLNEAIEIRAGSSLERLSRLFSRKLVMYKKRGT